MNLKNIVITLGALVVLFSMIIFISFDEMKEIPIQDDHGDKVVYTTDQEVDTGELERDCSDRGGTFNTCGSVCPPNEGCVQVCAYTCDDITGDSNNDNDDDINSAGWQTYSNNEYDFSVTYPMDSWSLREAPLSEVNPKFNIFQKPSGVPLDLPLDHFANVTHASIYPTGIATEGFSGTTRDFDLKTEFDVLDRSKIYTLKDGTPFAAYIVPADPPKSWNEAGFIWLRVHVEDMQALCFRNAVQVDKESCDPLALDDQIVHTGSVDTSIWEVEQEILANIRFLSATTTDQAAQSIRVITPQPNDMIESPLVIRGEAPGSWYFEGQFSVTLTDWDGRIIAEGTATAQDEWMTEEYVPFEVTLPFPSPFNEGDPVFMQRGSIILRKANPSGLPENDGAHEFTIQFAA